MKRFDVFQNFSRHLKYCHEEFNLIANCQCIDLSHNKCRCRTYSKTDSLYTTPPDKHSAYIRPICSRLVVFCKHSVMKLTEDQLSTTDSSGVLKIIACSEVHCQQCTICCCCFDSVFISKTQRIYIIVLRTIQNDCFLNGTSLSFWS